MSMPSKCNEKFMIKLVILPTHARDDNEETPLCCASEDQNNTEVVRLLLGAGADVNPSCKVYN